MKCAVLLIQQKGLNWLNSVVWHSKVKDIFSREALSRDALLTSSAYFCAVFNYHRKPHFTERQAPLKWFEETLPDPGAPTFRPCLRVSTSSRARWKSRPWWVNPGAPWPGADPRWFLWPSVNNNKNSLKRFFFNWHCSGWKSVSWPWNMIIE